MKLHQRVGLVIMFLVGMAVLDKNPDPKEIFSVLVAIAGAIAFIWN